VGENFCGVIGFSGCVLVFIFVLLRTE
jgi:hypothetical protein